MNFNGNAAFHRLGGVILPLFATYQGTEVHVPLRLPFQYVQTII